MKVAIMSDIHSNIEALEACVEDAKSQKVTHFVFLGDIVGYGPNPEECVKLVRSLDPAFVVMGNHDLFCTGVMMDMNSIALEAVKWTMKNISDDTTSWLRSLPITVTKRESIFVHSNLFRPHSFQYFMFNGRDLHFMEQEAFEKRVSFLGHTHRPELCMYEPGSEEMRGVNGPFLDNHGEISIDKKVYTTINVGSVGQPRDEQWKATYVISEMYNWDPTSVEFRRVEYDVWKTARKVFDSDLPNYNGERIIKNHPNYSV